MTTELATTNQHVTAELFEKLVLNGDLSTLSTPEKVQYYAAVCRNAGLDPVTKPFDLMTLQSKLTLYPNKTATAQLTKLHGLTVNIIDKAITNDTYVVHVRVVKKDGSTVDDIGVVSIANLKGEALSNAMMKATTKAKRRAILSAYGIGGNDESEVEGIWNAQPAPEQMELITAGLTAEEDDTVRMWREQIETCADAEALTEIASQLKSAPQHIRDSARAFMAEACERMNLVWKGGKYTGKVTA